MFYIILFNCIQSDEEDASEESDNENEGRQSKRRRLNEEDILRRNERRKWVENRTTILFNYLQYSYYGKPVCIIIYNFDNNKEILSLKLTIRSMFYYRAQ